MMSIGRIKLKKYRTFSVACIYTPSKIYIQTHAFKYKRENWTPIYSVVTGENDKGEDK